MGFTAKPLIVVITVWDIFFKDDIKVSWLIRKAISRISHIQGIMERKKLDEREREQSWKYVKSRNDPKCS